MYARVLRKWSLAKLLMNLWLPVVMLLVIWCQNVTSMHLLINTRSAKPTIDIGSTMTNDRPPQVYETISSYSPFRLPIRRAEASTSAEASATATAAAAAAAANVPNVPNLNSQIINLNNNNINIKDNDNYSSLTSSANIQQFLDSTSYRSSYRRKHKRHVQHTAEEEYGRGVESSPTRLHDRYERVTNEQFRYNPISMKHQNQQQQIEAKEWLYQQREKRARIENHRRRLIRLEQLSGTDAISDSDLNDLMMGRHTDDEHDGQQRHSRVLRSHSMSSSKRHDKRPKRYCSARDPKQLAFKAPTVLEAKVLSMSANKRGNFSVTFEVQTIFKQQKNVSPIKVKNLLRLQFAWRNTTGECDIYQEQFRQRGYIRFDLQNNKNYTLFVEQTVSGKYTILGQPILSGPRVHREVEAAVSENYGSAASIRLLKANKTDKMREGEELRIICRVRGEPPPKITWFKDKKSIKRNRSLYQFLHLKRKSVLIVKSFSNATAGLYECRAKNRMSKKVEKKHIRIEGYGRPGGNNDTGEKCNEEWNAYCLNGGTCSYFSDINQYYCNCTDGFVGDRCQEKSPTNVTLSTYNPSNICGRSTYYGQSKC